MGRRVVLSCYPGQAVSKHRGIFAKLIPLGASEILSLNSSEVVFLLTMHDLESFRSAQGLPSSLPSYFTNAGLNEDALLRDVWNLSLRRWPGSPILLPVKPDLLSRSCVDPSTI